MLCPVLHGIRMHQVWMNLKTDNTECSSWHPTKESKHWRQHFCATMYLLIFWHYQEVIIGPIPWSHSGPLCHALSSWTWTGRWRATVAAVATPGEWQCKTASSTEWAQHFSNASCLINWLKDGAASQLLTLHH